jgi:hypothetical protein
MKRLLASLALAFLASLLSAGAARAEFVPWSYNWEPTVKTLAAGTGGVTFTDEPTNHANDTSDIVATNLRTFSAATRSHPDVLNHAAYVLTLKLTDEHSGLSAILTFGGFLSGTLSATSANIANTFTGLTSQTVQLRFDTYTVTVGSYAPPGPPTASNAGSISAHVRALGPDHNPQGGGNAAPEPSTLLLSGVGLGLVGLGRWIKRIHRYDSRDHVCC